MIGHLLREYDPDVDRFDNEGYPYAWREIKHAVRAESRNRCTRCHHPYRASDTPEPGERGEWSQCDEGCVHAGPLRPVGTEDPNWIRDKPGDVAGRLVKRGIPTEAQWRILTVHHLDGDKANCRWWNLAPLCQRCHLSIQTRVVMDRIYDRQHTPWFMPYAAGFYAFKYLGEDLSRDEVENRMEELLLLELRQLPLFEGVMES